MSRNGQGSSSYIAPPQRWSRLKFGILPDAQKLGDQQMWNHASANLSPHRPSRTFSAAPLAATEVLSCPVLYPVEPVQEAHSPCRVPPKAHDGTPSDDLLQPCNPSAKGRCERASPRLWLPCSRTRSSRQQPCVRASTPDRSFPAPVAQRAAIMGSSR